MSPGAQGQNYKACPHCGTAAGQDAQFCSQCGFRYANGFQPPTAPYAPPPNAYPAPQHDPSLIYQPPGVHSVGLAVVLSLLCLIGAAQIYNRQVLKGIVLFVAACGLGVVSGGFAAIAVYIVGIIDAAMIAKKLHEGRPIRDWEFF